MHKRIKIEVFLSELLVLFEQKLLSSQMNLNPPKTPESFLPIDQKASLVVPEEIKPRKEMKKNHFSVSSGSCSDEQVKFKNNQTNLFAL